MTENADRGRMQDDDRPERFSEIIGNSHVTRPLSSMIASDSFPHVIFLHGPTGSGKTTLARLLGRAFLCVQTGNGSHEPCGQCSSCRIGLHQILAYSEFDAATFRDEDLIDLRSCQFSFTNFTVIDEVQQYQTHHLEAFKKIVEDCDTHIVICTTHRDSLDDALLNRLLSYEYALKRPSPSEIADYLELRCQALDVTYENREQLIRVARSYECMMRPCAKFPLKAYREAGGAISDKYLDAVFGSEGSQRSAPNLSEFASFFSG